MSTAVITREVKTVLGDLDHWRELGMLIAVIQATADGGVYVGVAGDPVAAEEVLGDRYPFPVSCWHFE